MESVTTQVEQIVSVHHVRNIYRRQERETIVGDWVQGLTIGDLPCPCYESLEVLLNGKILPRDSDWRDLELKPNDHVHFCHVPGNLPFAVWVLIVLVVDHFTGGHLVRIVGGWLAPPHDPREDKDNRATYGWNGPFTNYGPAGQPEPMQFGEHRVGGAVLAQYVEVVDGQSPKQFLNLLIMLSSGPIKAVGNYLTDQNLLSGGSLPEGLEINGNNASNFDDVLCSIRLGSSTQDIIPNFTFIPTEYFIGLLIDNVTAASGLPPVTDWSLAAVFDFPAGQEADRSLITVHFPGGLFRVNQSSGLAKKATVDVVIRYIELDGAGLPVGLYAELNPFVITAKNTSAFSKQFGIQHQDPEFFIAPSLSAMLFMNGNGDRWGGVNWPNPAAGNPWPVAWRNLTNQIDELTFTVFLEAVSDNDRHAIWAIGDFFGSEVAAGAWLRLEGNMQGLMVLLERTMSGSPALYGVSVLMGETNSAGTQMVKIAAVGEVEENLPFFLALTYKKDAVGTLNRVRIYLDGVIVHETLTDKHLVVATENDGGAGTDQMLMNVTPGHALTSLNPRWRGDFNWDETAIYQVEKSAAQIASLHNAFAWTSISRGPGENQQSDDPTAVAAWHFNFFNPGGTYENTVPAFHPGNSVNKAVVNLKLPTPGDIVRVDPGFVFNPGNNLNRKRARWRVEVQRTDIVQEDFNHHDTLNFQQLTAILDEQVAYRGAALLGLRIKATDQLNSSFPSVTTMIRGQSDCPVWDGSGDPDDPPLIASYSQNPAWQLAKLYLDRERGAGHIYDKSNINWPSFLTWANYCDVLVYDMKGKWGLPHGDTGLIFEKALTDQPLQVTIDASRPGHLVTIDAASDRRGTYFRVANVTDSNVIEKDYELLDIEGLGTDGYVLFLVDIGTVVAVGPPFGPTAEDATGEVQGIEPRIECDIMFDERGISFMDARGFFTTVGRARIVNFGDRVTAIVDQTRQPVAAFNAANIIAGSFIMSSVSTGNRFNTAVAEIQDRDENYARNPISLDHETLENSGSTLSVRRTTFDFRGVTKESQTLRELRVALNRSNLIHKSCKFGCALDGFFLDIGDVFILAHPIPDWENGGRCLVDGTLASVAIDHDIVIGQLNCLSNSKDLSDTGPWSVFLSVIVDPTPVADDEGELIGWSLDFPATANARIQQQVYSRGPGFVWTFIVWLKHVSGDDNDLRLEIVTTDSTVATTTPTVSSTWNRYVVSGTCSDAYPTNLFVRARILRIGSGGVVTVEVAKPRLIVGVDDGLDASGFTNEATDAIPTHYLASSNADLDAAVGFAPSLVKAGFIPEAGLIRSSSGLGFIPEKEWLWFIGPEAYGAAPFEVLMVAPDPQEMSVEVQALEVDPAVYHDEDDWPTLQPPSGNGTANPLEIGDDALPEPPGFVTAQEESGKDPVSGNLTTSLLVSWATAGSGARPMNVDRYRIWMVEDGLDPELMGEVSASETSYRIAGTSLDAGTRYEVRVQAISSSGLRTGLDRASGKRFTYLGLHVPPAAPSAVRALLHGEMATYETDLPTGFQATVVEMFRGGTFVGQSIGRIPLGGTHFGPTTDWCVLNAAADLRKDPPLIARLSTAQGSRGAHIQITGTLVPAGYTDLLDDQMEDGPWGTAGVGYTEAPILTNLVTATPVDPPGAPDYLEFTGSNLEGSYESTIYDLLRPRLTHVSFGIFGEQLPPFTLATVGPLASLRERSLSGEGYLDPGHTAHGKLVVVLLWAHSRTLANPGTDYERFRCGPHFFRSCRFKIQVTRPDATWDVHITRAGVVIRDPPHSTDVDGGGVS